MRDGREQALENIQLSPSEFYGVVSVTAIAVGGGAIWVWRIVENVRAEAKAALEKHKQGQSEEVAKGMEMLIKIMDSRKAESRIEWEKIWTRLESIRDTAVHKSDLQEMERKFDSRFDRLFDRLDKIVSISEQQVNHEVRIANIETVMKVD